MGTLGAAWCLLVLGEHRRCAHPLLTDGGEKGTEGMILLRSLWGGASFKTGIVDEMWIGTAAAEVLPLVGQTLVIHRLEHSHEFPLHGAHLTKKLRGFAFLGV